MNKARRKEIRAAIDLIVKAREIIEAASDDEMDAYDNLPESIQCSDRGQTMCDAAESLCDAAQQLEEIEEALTEVVEV